MRIELNIVKATVFLGEDIDIVLIETDMPAPLEASKKPLLLRFETNGHKGVEYCIENFSVFPNIINTPVIYRMSC